MVVLFVVVLLLPVLFSAVSMLYAVVGVCFCVCAVIAPWLACHRFLGGMGGLISSAVWSSGGVTLTLSLLGDLIHRCEKCSMSLLVFVFGRVQLSDFERV